MALTILDDTISSDRTPHIARAVSGENRGWEVSWLLGRRMDRNAAVTAMVLADVAGLGDIRPGHRLWMHVERWAAELGLTAPDVVARTTPAPDRTDPCSSAMLSDPEADG
jgi:hypothetical protein